MSCISGIILSWDECCESLKATQKVEEYWYEDSGCESWLRGKQNLHYSSCFARIPLAKIPTKIIASEFVNAYCKDPGSHRL
jgi:hypothetical protein